MKFEELARLPLPDDMPEGDLVWVNIRDIPWALHGVFYDEEIGYYIRMPFEMAKSVSDSIFHLNHHSAGGRLRFRTDSGTIAIKSVMETDPHTPHHTFLSQAGFDLYRRLDTEEREKYVKSYIPPISMTKGYHSSYSDDASFADYTIYFPVYDTVCELYLGLKKDSEILSARPYKNEKPVVFYGSSITQGGCACRTGLAYESIISRELDTEFINLGFSGSARGEKPIVDHIAGLDMSAFVLDYDHNAYDTALLEATHLPFYRAVREKNPTIPIIIISAPVTYMDSYWGPRREIIRKTYEIALSEGDRNVYFIDGETLFGEHCREECTVDGTHPNDLGMYRMACRIGEVLDSALKNISK